MSRTVLIVDDNKVERVVLKGFLRAEYNIIEAASGEEALAILNQKYQAISAIVMDIVMPGMDGFQTLKAIKSKAIWLQIPVIITTALDDEDSREKAISYGADNFVTKPFNQKLLLYIVQNAIRLREMAAITNAIRRDKLTNLLNREAFFKEAEWMINNHEPGYYILTCFDIENFKVINDQYGTEVGDEVLKHIASCLNSFVGDIKGLSGRYMADKFALLYPAAVVDSQVLTEKHAFAMSPACVLRPIRIRIGRYLVNDLSLPVSAMFDRAAMAENLIKGRYDTYIAEYTESMREELLQEQQIVNEMVEALHNGEFEPWFQPQYNHATGALIGSEALVRWRKDQKIIPPYRFISVFEKNGFIYEVDQEVWRKVCICLRRWLDEGKEPLPVSVNISRYDLYQEDFLEIISGLVQEYNLPADLLRLEITESAFADTANTIIKIAGELIERGFTVEIDDFGSGYSSLNTLKDVPAAILKLDMRFFEATENSQRGGNIIESVIRMAKWLGMAVIAEGVEEKAQADYLKTIGCYYIQGYFYARPMPLADYEKLMAESSKESNISRLETLETLDNNLFWDPKSMETLIFNSYVGGACIFEYCRGRSELLRANDQYIKELGGLIPIGAKLKDSSLVRFLDPEGKATLIKTLQKAAEQKKEASCEVQLKDGKQTEFIRITVRRIANTSERSLYYAVIVNLTEQREAERKQAESAEQLQVIMGNINGSVSAMLMDEIGNTTLIFSNDKYYELFGYSKEQAEEVHLDTLSCIVPEDYEDVVAKLNQLKKDGRPLNIDYRAQKQDGSMVYIRSNSSRMSMEGYGDQVIVSVETDITEKKILEDQLRAIVDNINGGVSATYFKGNSLEFLIVNDKYFEIVGYTKKQFEAEVQNAFDLVHPDDRERIEKLFREAAQEQKPYTMEYRIIRRNGAVRHILCNSNIMHLFGLQEPVQLSVINDITVLREVQQKEHNLSLQMQTIMESLHGGITAAVLHNQDNMEIVFANEGFYEMYGYTKEQLESELPNVLDLILPEDRKQTMETVERIARERGSGTYEYRCRKRDGSLMWTQVTNTVISMAGVGDKVLLAIATDITALRQAEQQNLAAMDRLKAVMNTMSDGMTAVAFHGRHTQFLFANDRYYEMHGISKKQYEQENLGEFLDLVYPEDRQLIQNLVVQTTEVGQQAEAEYRIQRSDGVIRWAKAIIKVTNLVGVQVPVQVTIFRDINAKKEADKQLRFLNDSAQEILAQPDSEAAIKHTLQKLVAYFGADRGYVVELDNVRQVSCNTYEVCAEGVSSEIENLRDLPFTHSEFWFNTLFNGRFLVIDEVSKLGKEKAKLRELLESQGIYSIALVPLRRDGQLIGFTGVDNPIQALEQIEQLTALADYISVLLTRRDLRRKIEHDHQMVQQLMDDAPGGFLRMEICEEVPPKMVSFNEGFCQMLDMTKAEVLASYGENAYKCLNQEDIASAVQESAAALVECSQFTTKCRLRRKDGSLLWVMVFGRFVHDEKGKLFLNSYFTDISGQKKTEEQQIELLDNLPSGAGLYEFDGKDLKVIHINQRYWDLVEREPVDYRQASIFGAIHPDDQAIIRQEIEAAIRQERNAGADVRLLCGENTYKPFHIAANITAQSNGQYLLYVSYNPISEEFMSIQEMLPIALSTMIAATEDISYVKDKDLRYICCSQSIADMTGFSNPRELIGKTAEEVFDLRFAEKFSADDRKILETGESVVNSLEHLPTAEGGICLVRTSKFPILNVSGQAIGVYCVSHDITAQKERESQLELLTFTIPGGLAAYSLSSEGIKNLYFNDGFYLYSGYSREEYAAMIAQEPLALVFEEDRPQVLELVRDFASQKQDGMSGSAVYRCRTKDGGSRWMSLKAVLSQVNEDTFMINAVQLDITDQMEIDNRRAELLDNLPFGAALFEFDGEHLIPIHINKQYLQLVNREIDSSLEGFQPLNFIHPEDLKIVLDEVKDSINNQRNGNCEIRLLYGQNEYRTFRLDAKITPKDDGNYLLYVAYTRITEQEINFKNLLPHIFSTIMESSTDLAFAKDINFRYLCCSKTFAQLLGLESEKNVIGKTDYELFSSEIADMFRSHDSKLFATGQPQVDILEIIPSPDGTPHYVRTTKHLLRSTSGEIMGIYSLGRDVTEIREAYAQLKLLTDSIPGGLAAFHCRPGEISLTYYNDGLCDLSGYSREEHMDSPIAPLDFVYPMDRLLIEEQLAIILRDEKPIECIFRLQTKGGGYKWVNCKAAPADHVNDALLVNAVLTDITEQQEEKERLRLAEEEYRLAASHSGHTIGRYNIAEQTLTITEEASVRLALPECITEVPYGRVKLGKISPDTSEVYTRFFESLRSGEKTSSVTFRKLLNNSWRWIMARATTIFDRNGLPVSAIVSYTDVTEQREKEAVYSKWQNSFADRPEDSYTLFRCNLSKSASFDSRIGKLLNINFRESKQSFDESTSQYIEQCVYADDRERYRAFMHADTMLAEYYRGHRSDTIEYREYQTDGNIRWLRLNIDLVEYPDSNEIEAYLMYENIDEQKRTELRTIERAETDPLTGVLNRATFAARVNQIISSSKSGTQHALLMLDIDNFKQVNDIFGHGAGDQTLTDLADLLTKSSRKDDLVGRLGGDEFLVFFADIPREVAAQKARQICELTRKNFSIEVQISSSIGVALYPQDGEGFESLYKIADELLYRVKNNGKNGFAFSHEEPVTRTNESLETKNPRSVSSLSKKVRRMLIVDDSITDQAFLAGLFKDDFRIEKAMDGSSALTKLKHYGSAISVVLLDLVMPGMDGFEVLEKMRQDPNTHNVPVIVVSGNDEQETALKVIKAGALDFVNKPVNADILRIRVESAVSKAENERLLAQNSYLSMRNTEISSYKSALERSGILVITLDWGKNEFIYSPSVSDRLAGQYDGRNFWRVLLSDLVTDSQTVQKMQHLVHSVAEDREILEGKITVRLKTVSGLGRLFEMNVFKEVNDYGLADKMLMTLREIVAVPKALS